MESTPSTENINRIFPGEFLCGDVREKHCIAVENENSEEFKKMIKISLTPFRLQMK
ncbi:MAG: hypothetical protein HQM13_18140 [SAR324 cluster bacterium]|nr:hypothetical protein [SAR324 cluster bacterium]